MGYEQRALYGNASQGRCARFSVVTDSKPISAMRHRRLAPAGALVGLLLVAAAIHLVHGCGPQGRAHAEESRTTSVEKGKPKTDPRVERAFHGTLPQNVVDMREMILAAVHSGDIAELREAIEWNEIPPDFGEGNKDPIAYWKRISADGQGRGVLAIAANLLALPPARLAIGKDPENTLVYVWPYVAELPLDQLQASEEVDLYRVMSAADVKTAKAQKKWTGWRLAIGADGTWHTFRKYD